MTGEDGRNVISNFHQKHKIQKTANNKQINIAFRCYKLILIETETQIFLTLKICQKNYNIKLDYTEVIMHFCYLKVNEMVQRFFK